ncbi:MAG: hypothetical protein ACP5LM_05595 [Thermoplasmata archaeon]
MVGNIFIKSELPQTFTLPQDYNLWDRAIFDIFFSAFPDLAQFIADIKFIKEDLSKKTAIGVIRVKGIKNEAFFPIIIDKGELYPFDVFIDGNNGKFYHAIIERILITLNQSQPFTQVRQQVFPDTVSPMMASMFPPFSKPIFKMAESSLNTIKIIFDTLKDDGLLNSNLEKFISVYTAILNTYKTKLANKNNLNNLLNILQLRCDSNGKLKLVIGSNKVYGPFEVPITDIQASMIFSEHKIDTELAFNKLKTDGYFTITINDGPATDIKIIDDVNSLSNPKPLFKSGLIIPQDLRIMQGFYIPNLVNFSDYKVDFTLPFDNRGIIINNFQYQRVDKPVVGQYVDSRFTLKGTFPFVGDIGMFYFPKLGIGTVPFNVLKTKKYPDSIELTISIINSDNPFPTHILVGMLDNKSFKVPFNLPEIPDQDGTIDLFNDLLSDAKYISLGTKTVIPSADTALLILNDLELKNRFSIFKVAENRYSLNFPQLKDYEANNYMIDNNFKDSQRMNIHFSELTKADWFLVAAQIGIPMKTAEQIINTVDSKGKVFLTSFKLPPIYVPNYKTAEIPLYSVELTKNLIRKVGELANSDPDESGQTVNDILKLGLLRGSSISEFKSIIAHIDDVLSDLAKLLIYARLGINQLSKETLSDVINELEHIRAQTLLAVPQK